MHFLIEQTWPWPVYVKLWARIWTPIDRVLVWSDPTIHQIVNPRVNLMFFDFLIFWKVTTGFSKVGTVQVACWTLSVDNILRCNILPYGFFLRIFNVLRYFVLGMIFNHVLLLFQNILDRALNAIILTLLAWVICESIGRTFSQGVLIFS